MQVGGLLTACTLPHAPTHHVMAAEWRDQPVPPVLRLRREQRVRGRVVNYQLIFSPSTPRAGLPVMTHVPTAYRKWPNSCALTKFPPFLLQLLLFFAQVSENYLFSLCWVKTSRLCHFSFLTFNSLIFYHLLILYVYLVCLSICPLPCFFPFPRFSPVLHLGAEPIELHQHTEPRPNLPLSLSLPMDARTVPGAAAEASPYHPPSSAHLLYLSAGTLPSTQTVLLHLPGDSSRK